jgi:hypothetical protein
MEATEEQKRAMREYYRKRKDRLRPEHRLYWQEHKKEVNKKRREEYKANPGPYKLASKKFRIQNPAKVKESQLNWLKKNRKEHLKKQRAYYKNYYNHLDKEKYLLKKRIYENNRRMADTQFRIKKRLRLRVWQAVKGFRKKMYDDEFHIDYRPIIDKLMNELPTDFRDAPSKYQIDHKTALYNFDLTNPEEIKKAFAPENTQWLTIEQHKEKTSKELSKE